MEAAEDVAVNTVLRIAVTSSFEGGGGASPFVATIIGGERE